MSQSAAPLTLDDLRRAIDAVDGALLDLLQKRFALSAGVKTVKSHDTQAWPNPMRPAREAQILKRLLADNSTGLNPELLVRLWRTILVESSLVQSQVTIHASRKLAANMGLRLMLRDHFGRFSVSECRDEAQAMVQINVAPGDLCIVETQSPWLEAFLEGKAGRAQVIACLPVLKDRAMPELLVLGVAPQQATGDDETLVVSSGNLPRDFSVQPLWQAKAGPHRLSALAGFFSEHEGPLLGLARSNPGLGLKVVGRYPSAIESPAS